ncbi:MAG: hypothetical protein DRP94_03395 [Candidatus Latescibacterota bacterium]|nr:MAG: hypothetical protein DRP94_03395 [Candidatus Latescibacterota bacterium]
MKLKLSFALLSLVLAASAQGTVIITEVFYDAPEPESKKEWIELYNPSSEPVDIGGYTIEDNQYTYTISSYTMAPGQTIICARDSTGFYNLYGFYPEFGDLNLPLGNSGDYLILRDPTGVQIDMVAWEGGYKGSHPEWKEIYAEEKSIQRKSLAQGPSAWLSDRKPNPKDPSPIPEPGTLILLGSGLAGFAGLIGCRRARR